MEVLPTRRTQPFSWIKLLADITTVCSIAVCIVLIVGYSVDLYRHGKQKLYIGWFSSAGFVLLTIPISIRIIVQHLTHWVAPNVQKYIVRIVWMIPIYAVESWIALRFKFMALYFEKIRESYEAYVIFCFMYYLIALLGGDEQHIALKLRKQAAEIGKQSWFSPLVGTRPTGGELLRRCKFGVFQYVLVKNVIAVLACLLHSQGIQHEGDFSFNRGYVYQCFVENISQLWALYCLVVFYIATKDELSHWRPVGKFLCVKSVVFFTWWQSIFIELFFATSKGRQIASNTEESWTVNELSKGLQDYLICIEMFFASIAFSFAFSYKDYDSYKKQFTSGKVRRERSGNGPAGDDADDDYDDENEEARPFLSAFFQSAIPDDIVTDLRKLAKFGHQLAWGGKNSNPNLSESGVGSSPSYLPISSSQPSSAILSRSATPSPREIPLGDENNDLSRGSLNNSRHSHHNLSQLEDGIARLTTAASGVIPESPSPSNNNSAHGSNISSNIMSASAHRMHAPHSLTGSFHQQVSVRLTGRDDQLDGDMPWPSNNNNNNSNNNSSNNNNSTNNISNNNSNNNIVNNSGDSNNSMIISTPRLNNASSASTSAFAAAVELTTLPAANSITSNNPPTIEHVDIIEVEEGDSAGEEDSFLGHNHNHHTSQQQHVQVARRLNNGSPNGSPTPIAADDDDDMHDANSNNNNRSHSTANSSSSANASSPVPAVTPSGGWNMWSW